MFGKMVSANNFASDWNCRSRN